MHKLIRLMIGFQNENQSVIFMPGYSKTDSKYPITGRKGAEIYAIYFSVVFSAGRETGGAIAACPVLNSFANIQSRAGKELKFMPYIAPEVVQEAKRMDLLTILQREKSGQCFCFPCGQFHRFIHTPVIRQL